MVFKKQKIHDANDAANLKKVQVIVYQI